MLVIKSTMFHKSAMYSIIPSDQSARISHHIKPNEQMIIVCFNVKSILRRRRCVKYYINWYLATNVCKYIDDYL